MFKITAFRCPDGRHCEWTTDDKRAADFLVSALRGASDWADVKMIEQVKS
jgi:hypothetical protein